MSVRWVFDRQGLEDGLVPILNEALTEAALIGADTAAREIKSRPGVPGQPVGAGGGRVSKEGETPTTQLGLLKASVAYVPGRNLVASAGTDVKYGRWLELKLPQHGGRPWLLRGIKRARRAMNRAFTKVAISRFDSIRLNGDVT